MFGIANGGKEYNNDLFVSIFSTNFYIYNGLLNIYEASYFSIILQLLLTDRKYLLLSHLIPI